MLYNLTVLVRWHEFGKPPSTLQPLRESWSEEILDKHLHTFFHEGPTNIHQIILAEALCSTWHQCPAHRALIADNRVSFTQGTIPEK